MTFDNLAKVEANYVQLTPLSFLQRAALVYPDKIAVIDGERTLTYRDLDQRCNKLGSALADRGIGPGDRVALLLHNTAEMIEAHFGVPLAGAVLVPINTRLDAASIQFILTHSGASLLIFDAEFNAVVEKLDTALKNELGLVEVGGHQLHGDGSGAAIGYERFLEYESPSVLPDIQDEWQAISLNYTSGTTGDPKGVVLHHRGAYLNACGNVMAFGLTPQCRYLWTLPMFHCNGWCHIWAVTAMGATHVCLRKFEPETVYSAIVDYAITHLCGAPVILGMLAETTANERREFSHIVQLATGGSAPPSTIIARMESFGFKITHLYGMTESFGPSLICASQDSIEALPLEERARFYARQGVPHPTVEKTAVLDPNTGTSVPADGKTIGELAIRSNTVMKGYFSNAPATKAALKDGWFHTGDLAVRHSDGYIEIRDRAKDIIISGGENISSLEVEEVLYQHPAVSAVAVVAQEDQKWGETPHAFIELKKDFRAPGKEDIMKWCKLNLAGFKCPRYVTFCELPKTATGKIQKQVLRQRLEAHCKSEN